MIHMDHEWHLHTVCNVAQKMRCLQSLCEFSSQHKLFVIIYLGYKAENQKKNLQSMFILK